MSSKDLARRTAVEVAFGGVDITASIRPYLLTVTYTDNEEDEADDLQLKLQDREGIWMERWLNKAVDAAAGAAGLQLQAVFLRQNWRGDGRDKLLDTTKPGR